MRSIPLAARAVAVALLLCFAATVPGPAGTASAASIVVLVNDDPVTEYDVSQRLTLIRLTSQGKGNRQQALDELIEERLKQQAADSMGISASESEVEQAFGQIASRVKLSPDELSRALRQSGVNPDTLRRRLRADLAWRDVVRAQMRRQVNIADSQVQAEISKRGDEAKAASYQYTLQPVIFVVPEGSSAGYKRERMQQASRFSSQFPGCDAAREAAKSFRDTVVQERVRRSSTELPDDMKEMLASIQINGATRPEEVENGVRVLGVCQREEVIDTAAAQKEIRAEMLNDEGQRLSRRLLIDLKQGAVIEHR